MDALERKINPPIPKVLQKKEETTNKQNENIEQPKGSNYFSVIFLFFLFLVVSLFVFFCFFFDSTIANLIFANLR